MATVPRNEHRNRELGSQTNNLQHSTDPTPQLPLSQWQKQSNDNQFTFWIDTRSANRATLSDSHFTNLTIPERATLVIGFKFTSDAQVFKFIQRAIRENMIWEPACEIRDVSGLFDSEFITFCKN